MVKKKNVITLAEAQQRFQKFLDQKAHGTTAVREVQSFAINTLAGRQRALGLVPHNTAVWQHTNRWHVAMIYIEKGTGFHFKRDYLDLYAAGCQSLDQFTELWRAVNGDEPGVTPKSRGSKTSTVRRQQHSYIVANQSLAPNDHSTIDGDLPVSQVHRTHLITSQITGIENNKGLLIDYDGWLNSNPMNEYELMILDRNREQPIIWNALVWQQTNGLHLRYEMYNPDWILLDSQEWVDDRWQYFWYYDKGIQDQL